MSSTIEGALKLKIEAIDTYRYLLLRFCEQFYFMLPEQRDRMRRLLDRADRRLTRRSQAVIYIESQ